MNRFKGLAVGTIVAFAGAAVSYSALAGSQTAKGETAGGETAGASSPARDAAIATVARGQAVRLAGEVVRVVDRDEFRLADESGSISVRMMWAGPAPVAVGDRVRVEGTIVDEKTFGVSRPQVIARTLRLSSGAVVQFDVPVKEAEDAGASAGSAASQKGAPVAIGSLSRGQSGTISGRVVAIIDEDEFRIQDDSGSVRVYVGWQNRVGVSVGETLTIAGMLDDDPWPIPAEFYASAITRGDGGVIDLRGAETGQTTGSGATTGPGAEMGATPAQTSRIADIRPYEIVRIEGVVDRITDEDEFRIRDDSGSVRVYIGWKNAMPVSAGDRVAVTGIVDANAPGGILREVYAHAITLADGTRVDLQPRREAIAPTTVTPARAPAGPVVAIDTVRRGQNVVLSGVVHRIRDTDEFILRDDTGSITIYIGWRNRMPVAAGDRVTVAGVADDDVLPGMRPEVYASSIVLADGRSVELVRGGRDE